MTITQAATSDLGLACGQTEPDVQSASYAKGKADTQCADSAIGMPEFFLGGRAETSAEAPVRGHRGAD